MSFINKLFYCIIIFFSISCEKNINWIDYDYVEVVRTGVDSTYFYKGNLLDGTVKKINDDIRPIFIFELKKGKLNGKYIEFHDNGSKKLESFYTNGILNGELIEYYSNNKIKEVFNYNMGLVDGERKLFWNNGGIKQVSQFKSGVLFGESKFYFSN